MKDSGVEWLGEIPRHWDVKRLKYMATVRNSNVDKKSVDTEDEVSLLNYTDVYYNEYITADIDFMQATATAQQIQLFELKEDDVVVTKDSESWDDIAVPTCVDQDLRGVVCAYHLTLIRPVTDRTCGRYLARYFASTPGAYQFKVGANGVTRFGLSQKVLRDSLFPLPPLHEQRAIAAYLDAETARIDKLIAKTERLNELLREKRTALISQAVTKGLDAGVAMKASGVEWLGEIPRHWDVKRLRFCATIRTTHIDPTLREFSQRKLIAPNHIESSTGRLLEVDSAEEQGAISAKVPFQQGDVLYSKIRPNLHKVCIAPFDGLCSSDIYPLLPNGNIISSYFLYTILCKGFHQLTVLQVMGATIPRINQESLMDILIPLPPLNEQRAIASYLDAETARIDRLIGKNDRLIHLLREKRSALISAAVTGKIAVPSVEPGTSC